MTVLSLPWCAHVLLPLAVASVLLVSCGGTDEQEVPRGTIGFVSGALGVISVEEPQAALVARDVLSAGGTAADAATAIGFTLSVTMPSSASLGGGGVCIARDGRGEKPVVIDFLPRTPKNASTNTERPSAIPSMPRGLFLLHSRFGVLKWERVVAPAENLARFGFNIPRAFASEFSKVQDVLLRDTAMAGVFRRQDGSPVSEGSFLKQAELASVLGRIRIRGVGEFYIGNDAKNLAEAVQRAGGSLSFEDLRDYRPEIREPISFSWEKGSSWHFAGPPSTGGGVAAETMAILMADMLFEDADKIEREHLLVEAAKRAFVERMKNLQADGTYRESSQQRVGEDYVDTVTDNIADNKATPLTSLIATPVDWPETPSAISFAVMDIAGGAVACTLTMNNLFGTGRMADGYGIVLAAAPDARGRTFTPLGPALLTNETNNRAYLAAAASGGVTAPTSLANVLARAAAGPQTLADAMRAPRTHYAGVPDKVFVETEMPEEIVSALRAYGHDVVRTNSIGRVAAVFCPSGIPVKENLSCSSATDPRGFGIALGGN